ncbi:major facilitator superfamily protein [Hirsutella rhossiliensis]|uniref:Major facilitator superfamily domain-containing protein n=1 Tax=Hirsutella rhossiliensis TaxID=111463 RepID=A0A9P8N9H5_9HYPO|nr:major facilitator superfamily domain-containing protein [Hirsutella rhossiliensis]KAH0968204.1 major facilitator superfamily domain-containing protein [Hirsutella rhossiliensis]
MKSSKPPSHSREHAPPRENSGRAIEMAVDEDVESRHRTRRETRKLLNKIDRHLLPLICVLYLLSCLDRSNLGNARRSGLGEDLKFTSKYDYNTAISIFFPFYLAVQIPSNLALHRLRPSLWIPSLMVAWSLVTVLLGFVRNFAGLLAMRCLLGVVEGGVFPGLVFYLTRWYSRYEYGLRISIFFAVAVAGGSMNGFLGDAIVGMRGVGGLNSWSWIFIIEGLVTLCVSGIAFAMMHDYPDRARFLTHSERRAVMSRLEEDANCLSDRFELVYVKHALLDWKIWVHMVMTVGICVPVYSIGEFLPVIIQDLGYSGDGALLMALPPHAASALLTLGAGLAADRFRQRGVFIIGLCVLAMIGFAILSSAQSHAVKYMACFLVVMGIHPIVPQDVAWNANNIGGSTKRAVGIAMHIGFGNLGGALAGFIIRQDDARRLVSGHGILLLITAASCMLAAFMTWYLRRENSRRDRLCKRQDSYTREEKMAGAEKGDRAPFFRYTV